MVLITLSKKIPSARLHWLTQGKRLFPLASLLFLVACSESNLTPDAEVSANLSPGIEQATETAKQTPTSPNVEIFTANPPGKGWIKTKDTNGRVNIRTQPTTDSAVSSAAVAGDEVKILKQTTHHQGHVWYFVQFVETEKEGWVRDDLLEAYFSEANEPLPPLETSETRGPASIPALNEQWQQEENLRYGEVRRRLIAQGWIPHTIETTGPARPYNPTGLVGTMYELGYEEVADCAGTGLAPCRFEFVYQDRTLDNGQVLAVIATVSSDPDNPDPYFAGMNADAYGVNTDYQNRAFDAALFAEMQQDERFCSSIGNCPVDSAVYLTQFQYAFQDAVMVARAYQEGPNRVVIFPRQPISREQALVYADILDSEDTIDLSDRNRTVYDDGEPIESYAAPGEGPRNLIMLVITPEGQVSEVSFVKPGAL